MGALSNYFAMGGYAGFVWPAFAVTAVVMGGLLVISLRALRARRELLQRLEAELGETGRPRRRRRGASTDEA